MLGWGCICLLLQLQGLIYVGATQVLEELGVLPYLKRFAGASAGNFAGNGTNGNDHNHS